MFEPLEERNLLSVATLSGGNLQISDGSFANDLLTISSNGAFITLNDPSNPVTAGAGLTQVNVNTATLPVGSLTGSLSVDLGFGTDSITFAGGSTIAARAGITILAEAIVVGGGATLSTRATVGDLLTGTSTANSGDLSISGQTITINTGARLLAHVEAGSSRLPGAISVVADVSQILRTSQDPPSASVTLVGVVVKGGAVEVKANSQDRVGVFGFKKEATAHVTVTDTTIDATSLKLNAAADTSLLATPAEIRTTGAFAFHKVEPGLDTIVRSMGSWITDGYLSGQSIAVVGTTLNDGSYVIGSVTATTITLREGYELAEEVAPNATLTGDAVLPDTEDIQGLQFPFTEAALVSFSKADAQVLVNGTSRITTTGNVDIDANGSSKASPFFPGLGTPLLAQLAGAQKRFQISAVWAQSDAIASASVHGTTQITSGGNVRVKAVTANQVTANAMANSTNTPVDLTFAGALSSSDTDAFFGATTNVTAGSVDVLATSTSDIQVAGTVANSGGSGVGLAVAFNQLTTHTDAHIDGTVVSAGDVNVLATVVTENFLTDADSRHNGSTKGAGTQVQNNFNTFARSSAGPVAGVKPGQSPTFKSRVLEKLFPTIKSGKLNLSGAVAIGFTEQTVNAFLAPNAHVDSQTKITVSADLLDHTSTSANSEATSDKAAAGGAVVYTDFVNTVLAHIGSGAVVNAKQGVDITSRLVVPYQWDFNFTDPGEVVDHLSKGLTSMLFTTFARNKAAGDKFALSASADIYQAENRAEAWIDTGALVNTNVAFAVPGQMVNVNAHTETNLLNVAGVTAGFGFLDKLLTNTVLPRIQALGAQSGLGTKFKLQQIPPTQSGLGGAFSYFDIDNDARAWIADNAVVKATDDVSVTADAEDRLITVTTASGAATKLGVAGSGALIFVDSTADAFIEDRANVTAGSDVIVNAHGDPRIYNLTGSVVTGNGQLAIGVSVSYIDLDSVVRAFLGDESQVDGTPTLAFNDVRVPAGTSLTFSDISVTGNPTLTFVDGGTNNSGSQNRDIITRSVGSFLTDGFAPGQFITVAGTEDNDGTFEVATVTATTITLIDGEELVAESLAGAAISAPDTITRATGSWDADGFLAGQKITISGTTSNDGTFTIGQIEGNRLVLQPLDQLQTQTTTAVLTAPDTITRSEGSWVADGFQDGQTITISGSGSNNGTFTIGTVTHSVLSLVPAATLTDETSAAAKISSDRTAANGAVTATGDLIVHASAGPQIYSAALAGSIATPKDRTEAAANSASTPGNGKSASSGKGGVGASGDVSFNNVSATTRAYISGAMSVDTRNVFVWAGTTGRPLSEAADDAAVTFAPNGAAADTISRNTGSWLADGFRPGQAVTVSGTNSNNGSYRIASVTDQTITLATGTLVAETSTAAKVTGGAALAPGVSLQFRDGVKNADTIVRSTGSWLADGFRPGQELVVQNAGSNNGTYTIDKVTPSTITLTLIRSVNDGLDTATTAAATLLVNDNAKQLLVMAVSGSVTIRAADKNSIGISGSYADNDIAADTRAFVTGATLHLSGDLGVYARTGGEMYSIAASGSGAGRVGIAGQVTNDDIANLTFAYIDGNASLTTAGTVGVRALDDSSIFSISGAVAFGGKAGIGASVAMNDIANETMAWIGVATVAAGANIAVTADAVGSLFNVTAALAASTGGLAAAAAVSLSEVGNTTRANLNGGTVSGQAINVAATDRSLIEVYGGGLGAAQSSGFGASVAINEIHNILEAFSKNAIVTATGDMKILATSAAEIQSITVGGAGAGSYALGGSVSLADIANTVAAYLAGGTATATGSLQIAARSDDDVLIVGGGLAGAGTASVGLGNATALTNNSVLAYVAVNSIVTALGNGAGVSVLTGAKDSNGNPITEIVHGLAVSAVSFEKFVIVAAGGAGAGNVGIAGSAAVNVLNQTTRAYIDTGAQVNAINTGAGTLQDVVVRAADLTSIVGVGGALAGAGDVGIGAGADVGVITKITEAYVSPKTLIKANRDVRIEANSDEDIVSVAASLAAAGSVALAGSASVYVLNVTTRAFVADAATAGDGAAINAEGSVVVTAQEHTEIDSISGNLSGSGAVAVGVAGSVPIINKTTEAFVGAFAVVDAKANRAAVVVPSGELTISYVTAVKQEAFPRGAAGGKVTGTNLEIGGPGGESYDFASDGGNDINDQSLSKQRVATPGTRSIRGLAVTAVNRDDIETIGASGSASGAVTVNVGGSVNVISNITLAHVDAGAKINFDATAGANQDVLVAAGNDYYHMGIGAALGASGAASIAPGADVLVATFVTRGFVEDGADVRAKQDVSVLATGREKVLSVAGGVALSGGGGVAGSATVNLINATTEAYVGNSAATDIAGAKARAGGNLLISARDESDATSISGSAGLGLGSVGIGLSAGVIRLTKTTRAFVGTHATVDALGGGPNSLLVFSGEGGSSNVSATESTKGLGVQAYASENVLNVGVAGGVGFGLGVGGGVAVNLLDSNTSAFVDNDANVNEDRANANAAQGVNISAVNTTKVVSAGAGGGAGLGAGGVGVDVGILRNDTTAFIDSNASVTASKDVDVNALANKDIDSYAISGALGGLAAAGSVSVWAIGAGFDSTYSADNSTDNPLNDTGVNVLSSGDKAAGGQQSDGFTKILSGQKTGPTFAPSAVNTGSDLFTLASHGYATGDAVVYRNGGGANIGGLTDGTKYFVIKVNEGSLKLATTRSQAMSGQAIDVNASGATGTSHKLVPLVGNATTSATNSMNAGSTSNAVSGITGASGGAAIAGTTAFIGTGATVTAGDDVNVRAEDKVDFFVLVGGITAGGGAVGGSVAIVAIGQQTQAYIDDNATIQVGSDSTDDVFVHARQVINVDGRAYAGSFSLLGSLAAQAVVVKDTSVQNAFIDAGAKILRAGGKVTIEALVSRIINVQTIGGAVSAGVAVGASLALADVTGSTTAELRGASIGQTAAVVRNLSVTAESDSRVTAHAIAVSGGILLGVSGAVAKANVAPTVTAGIGANSLVTTTEDIAVEGHAFDDANAKADGVAISAGAAGGAAVALATLAPVIVVSLGTGAQVTGRNIKQKALHNYGTNGLPLDRKATANALAGAGGLAAGAAGADARASVLPTVNVSVASGAVVTASGDAQLLSLANNLSFANGTGIGVGLLAGVGAALADAQVGGSNQSRIDGATVHAANGDVEITTDWSHDATATVVAGAGGIGAGVTYNKANADVFTSVKSFVLGAAELQAGDDVIITAKSAGGASANAKGISVGVGAGAGASIAKAQLRPTVSATIEGGTVRAGDDIQVQALSNAATDGSLLGFQATASGNPSGGGLVGFNGAEVTANAAATTNALVSSGVSLRANANNGGNGDVLLAARAKNFASATSSSLTVGIIAGVGRIYATATSVGQTNSRLDGSVLTGQALSVLARSAHSAIANAAASGGGIVGSNEAVATASDTPTISARIGNGTQGSTVTVGGDVVVRSETDTATSASGTGSTGGVVGIGSVKTISTASPSISTSIGSASSVTTTGGSLTVESLHNQAGQIAYANSTAAGGGIVSGVGTSASATSNADVQTFAGANVILSAGRDVNFVSRSDNTANAFSDGKGGGVVSKGEVNSFANSLGTTKAELRTIQSLAAGTLSNVTGNVSVLSKGTNSATTSASAATGGVVNVAGSKTSANVDPTVATKVDATGAITADGSVSVISAALGGSTADAYGAGGGLVDVGSSQAFASWLPDVDARIDNDTTITAGQNITLAAYNNFSESGVEDTNRRARATGSATGGGLASIRGADVTVNTDADVDARVGNGATLNVGQTLNLRAKSRNRVEGFAAGQADGLVGNGSTVFTSSMRDDVYAVTEDGNANTKVRINGGTSINLDARSNDIADISVTGGAGGLVGGGAGQASVILSSPVAKAALGAFTIVNSPLATVNVTSDLATDLKSVTRQSVSDAVAFNETKATAQVLNGQSLADLANSASVTVGFFNQVATSGSAVSSDAQGDVPFNLVGSNTATAVTTNQVQNLVHVAGGVTINATNAVAMQADVRPAVTNSRAKTSTTGLTGTLYSNSHNDRQIVSNVVADGGSSIHAQSLTVISNARMPALTLSILGLTIDASRQQTAETNAETVTEFISEGVDTVFGALADGACWLFGCDPEPAKTAVSKGIRKVLGAEKETNYTGGNSVTNDITFNSTVTLGAATSPKVEIDSTGKVIALTKATLSDGNHALAVGDTITTGQAYVGDIANNTFAAIRLIADYGTISGNSTWNYTPHGPL